MQQQIEQPTEQDMERIATLLAYSGQLSMDITGQALDSSTNDLPRLQQISSTLLEIEEAEQEQRRLAFQAVGISFGQVFATENSDYDWWMVNDEEGRDPCLRYRESDLLVFPQTLISRRVEEGESFNINDLYTDIKQQLRAAVDGQLKPN